MRYSFTFLIPLLFFFLSNTISAQIPTSGLVAWYPFNNNANDASGNGRNGTVIGAALTTDRFGNTKSAYYFNGTDNYITLPTAETIYGLNPNEWTLTAWASTSAVKAQSIVTDAYSSGWDNYYGSSFSMSASNDICASARNNITGTHQTYDIYTNVIAQYNTWYLISMTVSKTTGNIKVYINNTLINTVPFNVSADYMESTPMSIGASYFLGAFTGFFSGKIDDIRMYSRALAANEVTAIYNDNGWPVAAPVRDIDGNTYDTVKIGTQIWMKQNLKTTKYSDGTSIPNVTDNAAWGTLTTPAFCWYNNDASTNKDLYGGLYNWYTVNTGKLCPSGWHLPSDAEWTTLETYLGGSTVAGGKMKEAGLVHWTTPNTGATNLSGITALPGGFRDYLGEFGNQLTYGQWWASDEDISGNNYGAWRRLISYNSTVNDRNGASKKYGFSVRCLKDGPGSGLVASYPFNGNANDVSGNGNNGTNNGAVLTSDRFNNSGSAYRFNGSSYISVPDNNTLDFPSGSNWAVNIWVSLELPATVDQMPISKYNSVGLGGFFMSYVGATGKLGLDGRDQTAYRLIDRTTFPRSDDGKWHMLTGMRTGSVWSFWLDGIKMGELDAANTTALSNTQPLIIGGHVDVTGIYPNFKGLIDDIQIYNRALSAAEIDILYKEDGWPQSAPVIDIDGNTYDTVKIGTQTWMKQNLKTTKYNDGTNISNITDNSAWLSLSTGAYCNYNNDISIANIYGKLYNFFAVADSRKLCPVGWHVPSDTEFKTLETYMGMAQSQADLSYSERGTVEGGKLKESGTIHWAIPNTGANNSSGFTALPAGYRNEIGVFSSPQNWSGYWWQSSEYNTSNSWYRGVQYNVSTIWRFNYPKQGGFSVRCLKDDLNSGLVANFPFNGNTIDESGNGNNADIVISSLYSADRFGKSSKTMNFNGTSSYAYTSANNALDSYNTGTVSFWINGSALRSIDNAALSYSTDATFGSLFVFGVFQGKAFAQFKQDSYGHNPLWIGSTEIKNDKWYHIAYVSDGNSMMKIYVNGIDNIITFDPNTTPANGSEWFTDIYGSSAYNHFISIGALRRSNQAESFFPGSIDDIRIFSRALSISEIDALYHEDNWALPPVVNSFTPTSGPVGSLVTITGTNFDPIPDNNIVWFGAVKAAVSSSTTTELVVTVPNGTTYQPISVTTTLNGLTGYSSQPFNVTFPSLRDINASSLASKTDFASGAFPFQVAIGDIDGDGKPDLVVSNETSNSISIYRNNSISGSLTTSSFSSKVDFPTGNGPQGIAIGDIDGDGKPDIAVTNYLSNSVSIFKNISIPGVISTASLATRIDFTTVATPFCVAIDDFDGDGKPDLAVPNYAGNTLSIYRNICTPGTIDVSSFAAKVDFLTGSMPLDVVSCDLDGDGKSDLAVTNYSSNTVSLFRNTSTPGSISTGSFANKVDLTTGSNPHYLSVGDIDGDNKADLAVANYYSNTLSVFQNISTSGILSSGSFAPKVDFITGSNPLGVDICDFDGDSKPDLAVTNDGSNKVSLFRNKSVSGSISTSSLSLKVDFTTGTKPHGVAFGDLDSDGKPDLALTNYNSNTVSILRNTLQLLPPAPLVGTIIHPTCTTTTGSVILNGLPDSGTWTITRSPGGSTTTGSGTSITITGLEAGTYSFTVTNAASVTSVASSDVVINAQPVSPSAPVVGTITQPTCALSSGSVALSGLPASGTWTLTRTPGGTTTTGTGTTTNISGLAANTYIYTVSNGSCTSIASANIVINAQPVTPAAPVLGTITQPTCSVATGGVDLSGLPATGTWTLTRSPGNTITTGTGASQTISDLAAGTYTYTVTNSSSCTSVSSASIVINSQPLYPSAPVIGTITQPTCSVGTGSVELSELPASGTWTLTGSPGGSSTTGTGTTRTISGLTPGTYTYSVTNASSCTSSPSSNIIINAQPITPSAPIAGTITHPTCSLATGSLELTGLPAAGTWTLTRMPGVLTTTGTGTSVTLAGIPAGTYTYSVTNGSACTSVASSNIVINPQPATPSVPVVGNITHPTCKLGTGSIFLNGLPATGTWSLTCSPGGTITNGSGTTTTITGLTSGTYSFILSIGTGCTSSFGNVIINAVPIGTIPVIIKKWNDVLICTNLNNKIDKYQWYKGTTPLTGETQEQFYWAKNQPGAYQVLTTDKDGCKNYSNIIQIGSGSKSLTAFPNPVRENVTIDLNDEPTGKAVISIFNDIGIKVLEFKTEKEFENLLHELSVETLDEGIYLIRVTVDKVNVYNTKIVVAK